MITSPGFLNEKAIQDKWRDIKSTLNMDYFNKYQSKF